MAAEDQQRRVPDSFLTGLIALVFLIIGYQTALFVHRASVVKIAADRDAPDTVYIYEGRQEIYEDRQVKTRAAVRHNAPHEPRAEAVRNNLPVRKVETFRFDPNTVSVEDLCRLGFSPKQAQSIENYRSKGGRFRRKSDFEKSYVVSDSIYRRLEPYIDIPLLDLNLADSSALDALPGIGGWTASAIISHRKALGGYSCKEQLMDIRKFDQDRFDALKDLVTVNPGTVRPYPLWELPADSLMLHPYIRNLHVARAVVLYRDNNPREAWTVRGLLEAGIISSDDAQKLSKCILAEPL